MKKIVSWLKIDIIKLVILFVFSVWLLISIFLKKFGTDIEDPETTQDVGNDNKCTSSVSFVNFFLLALA